MFRVRPENWLMADYGLRYSLCLLTFGLAAAIPKLDLFISLVEYVLRHISSADIILEERARFG